MQLYCPSILKIKWRWAVILQQTVANQVNISKFDSRRCCNLGGAAKLGSETPRQGPKGELKERTCLQPRGRQA